MFPKTHTTCLVIFFLSSAFVSFAGTDYRSKFLRDKLYLEYSSDNDQLGREVSNTNYYDYTPKSPALVREKNHQRYKSEQKPATNATDIRARTNNYRSDYLHSPSTNSYRSHADIERKSDYLGDQNKRPTQSTPSYQPSSYAVSNSSLNSAIDRLEEVVSKLKRLRNNSETQSKERQKSEPEYQYNPQPSSTFEYPSQDLKTESEPQFNKNQISETEYQYISPQPSSNFEYTDKSPASTKPTEGKNTDSVEVAVPESSRKTFLGRRYWTIGYMHESLKDYEWEGNGYVTELSFANAFGISKNLSFGLRFSYSSGDAGDKAVDIASTMYERAGLSPPPGFLSLAKESWSDVGRSHSNLFLSYQFDPLLELGFVPHLGISLGYYADQVKSISDSSDYVLNRGVGNLEWGYGTSYSISLGAEYLISDDFSILSDLSIQNIDPTVILSLGGGWLFTESLGLVGKMKFGQKYFSYITDFYWHF